MPRRIVKREGTLPRSITPPKTGARQRDLTSEVCSYRDPEVLLSQTRLDSESPADRFAPGPARAGGKERRPSTAGVSRWAGQLEVRSERCGADHLVAVFGDLDIASAQSFEDELKAAEATNAGQIILDLSGLDFIDSTGIHLIVKAGIRSGTNGKRLKLRRGPKHVQRVFEITGTADTLPFTDSEGAGT